MNTLSALIVDDEKHCQVSLAKMLEWYCPQIELMGACSNVDEGIEKIKSDKPDIVFLDIEMPVKNGFDLIQSFEEIDFHIIFTTAYDEFALQAFKVNAIAYLLKPIDKLDLESAISRITSLAAQPSGQQKLMEIYTLLKAQNQVGRVAIPTLEGIEFIDPMSIIRCEAEGNYTRIYLTTLKQLYVSKTLKQITPILSAEYFIRPHASHIVNFNFVKKYIKGTGGQLVLDDNTIIPVSRQRKKDLNL